LPDYHTGFTIVNDCIFLNAKIFDGTKDIVQLKLRRALLHEGGHLKWRKGKEKWKYNEPTPEKWNMMVNPSNTNDIITFL